MAYSHRHSIQTFIGFGLHLGMLCVNLYRNQLEVENEKYINLYWVNNVHSQHFTICLLYFEWI